MKVKDKLILKAEVNKVVYYFPFEIEKIDCRIEEDDNSGIVILKNKTSYALLKELIAKGTIKHERKMVPN